MSYTDIRKPSSASRRWRSQRKSNFRDGAETVREPCVNTRHNAKRGEHNRPKPIEKPAPFDVTAFQKQAHEATAVAAHEFHAKRGLRGAFGQSPGQKSDRARWKAAREALKNQTP